MMKKSMMTALLVALATPALAHTGHGGASGLLHGLAHPLLGADHLLAMLAVGLWSGFVLPRRLWAGPAVFMAAMAFGAGLGWSGVGFPMVETVITGSVVAFGLMTLCARRGQSAGWSAASLAMIAVFAAAHGQAHAAEVTGAAAAYLGGFLATTVALHLAGIAFVRSVAARPVAQKALGAGITLSGLLMMAG